MIIEAGSLHKRYGDVVAVDSLDLEVEPGMCYGLVGPNGAGKTTTMKMIYCIVEPTSGSLEVFGLDVRAHPREIKARLGVVPQENNLDPDLSTCQNLRVYARYFGIPKDIAAARCHELLEFMHLGDRADAPVPSLSGGMKRRLILARALMNEPDLIILDEPTTGLDPQVRHLIWDRLLELKERGITLLLTTHYMDEAQKLCDKVLIMDEARSIDVGSPAELIRGHMLPYVLELRVDRKLTAEVLERFRHLEHQASGQNLYFYGNTTSEFDDLTGAYPDIERLLRPASLEDVFLKLTGREIRQ
ncbi:MAG: ATP-binding cassette domain-containing protein [Thermoleophilia bacterium]|nr:ATP-binding cassette domain-containing protein [Thermoleophilia bacterium]